MKKHFDTIIFCDLDGTITKEETFVASIVRISEKENLETWFGKFLRHEITLRECTETLFSLVPSDRYARIEEYTKHIEVREGFREFLDCAAEKGIPVVVISGGIRKMQEQILAPYRDEIADFYSCELDTTGEYMRFVSEYASEEQNMDKVRIMDLYDYDHAICIGDSIVDLYMAQHADIVFARDQLCEELTKQGKSFFTWETFHDVAAHMRYL